MLPTTLQNMHNAAVAGAAAGNELASEEHLDAIEEELNRKVDADTEVLVEGMAELVKMSKVSPCYTALHPPLWLPRPAIFPRSSQGDTPASFAHLTLSFLHFTSSLQIDGKDHFRVAQEAFQAECRTESMVRSTFLDSTRRELTLRFSQIRAAHSLLSLSHTLKLLHLFADTATPTITRERLAAELEKDIEAAKAKVDLLVAGGATA